MRLSCAGCLPAGPSVLQNRIIRKGAGLLSAWLRMQCLRNPRLSKRGGRQPQKAPMCNRSTASLQCEAAGACLILRSVRTTGTLCHSRVSHRRIRQCGFSLPFSALSNRWSAVFLRTTGLSFPAFAGSFAQCRRQTRRLLQKSADRFTSGIRAPVFAYAHRHTECPALLYGTG